MCSAKFYVIFLLLQVKFQNCCHGTQIGKKKSLGVEGTFYNLESKHPGVYRFAAHITANVNDVTTPSALILKCGLNVNIKTEPSGFKHAEIISKKYDVGAGDEIRHIFIFSMANEYQEFVRKIKCTSQLKTTDTMGLSVETIDLADQQFVGLKQTNSKVTPVIPLATKNSDVTPVVSVSTKRQVIKGTLEITGNMDWTEEMKDRNSDAFKNASEAIKNNVKKSVENENTKSLEVEVTKLSKGSVVVDFYVKVKPKDDVEEGAALAEVKVALWSTIETGQVGELVVSSFNSSLRLHDDLQTPWSTWSSCSEACGGGAQTRTRLDESGDSKKETQSCNEETCPDQWTQWSAWSNCSKVCGEGNRTRTRSNENATVQDNQTVSCNDQPCVVNGNWTEWKFLKNCSVTCTEDGNRMQEYRQCTNPAPQNNGSQCTGENIRGCKTEDCLAPHSLLKAGYLKKIHEWLPGKHFHLDYNSSVKGSSLEDSFKVTNPKLLVGVDDKDGKVFGVYTKKNLSEDIASDQDAFIFRFASVCSTDYCPGQRFVAQSNSTETNETASNSSSLLLATLMQCKNVSEFGMPQNMSCSGQWAAGEAYLVD